TPRHVWPDYVYHDIPGPASAPGSHLTGKKRRKYAAYHRKTKSLGEEKVARHDTTEETKSTLSQNILDTVSEVAAEDDDSAQQLN
ncbi:unnamed protein product, partial [Allacma fusca]